jgi:hypothetical protein
MRRQLLDRIGVAERHRRPLRARLPVGKLNATKDADSPASWQAAGISP